MRNYKRYCGDANRPFAGVQRLDAPLGHGIDSRPKRFRVWSWRPLPLKRRPVLSIWLILSTFFIMLSDG
jgi:hypothetical protein